MDGVSELVEEMIQVAQFIKPHTLFQAFERQVALVVKNLPANTRNARQRFSPWVGKSPGEGNGNPLQYSFLENPVDGGARWGPVHW